MTTQLENFLFCLLDGLTPNQRVHQRLAVLQRLNLTGADSIPVFEEATQTIADFLTTPIALLTLLLEEELLIKSAVGLSRLGLMNELAVTRKISIQESFCINVIDSKKNLAIADTFADAYFSRSILAQNYSIRSYLGTPLITSEGCCIGTLAVMDFVPRKFSDRELSFINLTARWCLGELERDYLSKSRDYSTQEILPLLEDESEKVSPDNPEDNTSYLDYIHQTKIKLVRYFSNELANPLTSVIGMSSILSRQIYGKLTPKQKEYLKVIHNSGQNMSHLVQQINNLGILDENINKINLVSVDLEMLCQQVINSLNQLAKNQQETINLSIAPGNRIWLLDKEKSRQALYYLVISVMEFAPAGGEVRIHVSKKIDYISIYVWIDHPCLGNFLPQVGAYPEFLNKFYPAKSKGLEQDLSNEQKIIIKHLITVLEEAKIVKNKSSDRDFSKIFQLLYSCYLAEIQGGEIAIQGTEEYGYRYVLKLPKK
jgi:signal transduction histidine kinase